MTKLTQALPVSPVYSISVPPSLPPSHHRERPRLHSASSLWYDHSESAIGQRSENNARTVTRSFRRSMARTWPFYFHKFHIQNYHCSIQHNWSFVCVWCGAEADPCFKSSLSVTALDLVTTLFSQLCALFQSRSLFHVMTQLKLKERELFNLSVV